jgi:3'-phosphoadenosine 5'-phosphosulfate sulfotransferase (PAPS reductase)/FAD synthetase
VVYLIYSGDLLPDPTWHQASASLGEKMDEIKVNCKAADTLDIQDMTLFQGELKTRTDADYEHIKKSILDYGFCAPFFIWEHDGINSVLDGTGRYETLQRMKSDGYDIPLLPVAYIDCKDEATAKKVLLQINSHNGTMTVDSVRDFLVDVKFDFGSINLSDGIMIDFGESGGGAEKSDDNDDEDEDKVRKDFGDERDNLSMKDLLFTYDNIAMSFSGGKDSIALALTIKEMGLADRTTMIMVHVPLFTFSDEVDYAKYCAEKLGMKLEVVQAPDDEQAIVEKLKKRGWPGRLLNWCNSDLKVKPLNDYYKTYGDKSFIMIMGTRAEESQRRAMMRSRGKWGKNDFAYPIFDLTTDDVVKKINDAGIAVHHVYQHYSRFSCSICYQQTKGKWKKLKQFYPEEWERAIKLFGVAIKSGSFRKCDYCAQLLGNMTQDPREEDTDYSLPFKHFWKDGKIIENKSQLDSR